MKNVQKKMMMMMATLAVGMSGCGAGSKLVQTLNFSANDEAGHLMAGFDAKLDMGNGMLPDVKLPIFDPNSPGRFLGYLETHFDGGLSIRIDVTESAHVRTVDGSFLPNGREIPLVLPAGVTPIAIPVINSNSKVYLAVGSQNIMAGVAVTLAAGTSTSGSDWVRVLNSIPANIFYPFQIASDIKGTAGMFTGDKVGVGVFAIKTLGSAAGSVSTFAGGDAGLGVKSLAAVGGSRLAPAQDAKPEVFGVKTQYPVGLKAYRIQRAVAKVRETKLD